MMANDRRSARDIARHGASTCQWATPTLFLDAPFWFEAQQYPWTCAHDAAPHLLGTTEVCANCRRWLMRRPETPAGKPAAGRGCAAEPLWMDWIAGAPAPHETD